MEILELEARPRESTGKGKARQMRRTGQLPANLYGEGTAPTALVVDAREFGTLIGAVAGTHVILRLSIDGRKIPAAIVKEVQRNPVRNEILHVDFQSVKLDQLITAPVTVSIVGDSLGVREGGIMQHGVWELTVEALPTEMPDHLEVDISDLAVGQSLYARDIPLPPNIKMMSQSDEMVVTILAPTKAAEVEVGPSPEAAAELAEEGAEGT